MHSTVLRFWLAIAAVQLTLLTGCSQTTGSANKPSGADPGMSNAPSSTLDLDKLCKHWRHSYEEQAADSKDLIYRKEEFNFPPSRFRKAYILEKDHTCQWYYLSPDDAHKFKPGRWSEVAGSRDTIEIEEKEKHRFMIVELTDDKLVLREIKPQ